MAKKAMGVTPEAPLGVPDSAKELDYGNGS
jgi:hypothetical protein